VNADGLGPPLDAYWMPFTSNRSFKSAPRLVSRAAGMHYFKPNGEAILDGCAGLWCVNLGHAHPAITRAIRESAEVLDYAPSFNLGHPFAFVFADRLTRILPAGLDRIFFTNSGSESADTAIKIAIAYHRARGEAKRVLIVGRQRGYHGVNLGGLSVGGIATNREAFESILAPFVHLPDTHDLTRNAFTKGQPIHGAARADWLADLIEQHGADRIAAVMVEPLAGSTGVLVPPVGYLERLRDLCNQHGILLIFDEVITGFGRLGHAFASNRFGIVPDIVTMAKGITNGAVPMGAVAVQTRIHDTILGAADKPIEFFHGYTSSGHPLACAAGLAALAAFEEEGTFARAAGLESAWQDALHDLSQSAYVKDIRTLGIVGGIELEPRAGAPGARARQLFEWCFDHGALVRVTGDIVALSPPLIISETQIDQLVDIIRRALLALS
jgi:beta-alanine--pyruvate transaminase